MSGCWCRSACRRKRSPARSSARKESVMPVGLPENQYESELARLLYTQLSQHTGIRPAWGILTGVRPVKLVQKRLAAGMDDDQIRREMTGQDLVSEGKSPLR